jgi:predicted RNA-binding Zn-ribbon protein involved in translation (DUF1610 family)
MSDKQTFLRKLNNIYKWSNKGFLRLGVPCSTEEINNTLQCFEEEQGYCFWPKFIGDPSNDSNIRFLKNVNEMHWTDLGFQFKWEPRTIDEVNEFIENMESVYGIRARLVFVDICDNESYNEDIHTSKESVNDSDTDAEVDEESDELSEENDIDEESEAFSESEDSVNNLEFSVQESEPANNHKKETMVRHLKDKHVKQPTKEVQTSKQNVPTPSTTPAFSCDTCSKSFYNQSSLTRHAKSLHWGQKLECDKCGQLFTRQSNLSKHGSKCAGSNTLSMQTNQ